MKEYEQSKHKSTIKTKASKLKTMIRGKNNGFLTLHIALKLFSKLPVGKHHMLKNKQHRTQTNC